MCYTHRVESERGNRPGRMLRGSSGEPDCGTAGRAFESNEFPEMGVKRISVGSALSRAALSTFYTAAREMKEHKTFIFAGDALKVRELHAMFERRSP